MGKRGPEVALTTPYSPIGLTLELGILWEELLERKGLKVSILSNYSQTEVLSLDESVRVMGERMKEWRSVLERAGGLVIAAYNTKNIDWDRGIIDHIHIANEVGRPVFSQVDPADVWKPLHGEEIIDRADMTIGGGNVDLVRERLLA